MQIKNILEIIIFTSLCANASVVKDDCNELSTLLSSQAMTECKVNSNGELVELSYCTYDENTTEEGYKKALSYPTLKKLSFRDEYSDCNQLTYGLSNLKNLEELNIRSFRGHLAPNTLKGLSSLKKFSYDTGDSSIGDFSKQNLEELGTLTNLESLTFAFTSLNKEGLSSLQNLNKVTSLTLDSNGKGGMDVPGCLSNLKNLKELAVTYDIKNQSEVDAITSYANLEKLTVEFRKDKINCDNMKNLTKLQTLDLKIEDVTEVPSCVYSIPNLKKLTFNGKDVPLQNGGNTTTGNNDNQTTGNNTNQTTGNNDNQATESNTNQATGSNTNQTTGNNTNQTTGNNTNQTSGNNTNQTSGNNANQDIGNNTNQSTGNNDSQATGNNASQATGNNADQTAENNTNGGTTTTTDPIDDIDENSGAGSTIVHAINYLPIVAVIFNMLL